MIRILHSVSNMDRAGIETMLMNYYRHMDREKVQFDFLCNKSKPGAYEAEIEKMGGRVFRTPGLNPFKYPKYLRYMKTLFSKYPEYRIVEAHNGALGVYALNAAKRNNIPVRIYHAHGASITRDWKYPIKIFCKSRLKSNMTEHFTCGIEAARCYYGDAVVENGDYELIPNAIEIERFVFNRGIREELRAKYNLSDKHVIGHVGRFMAQKNHAFLIEVFENVAKMDDKAVLVLLGDGELMVPMKELVESKGLSSKIVFVGNVGNANEWYSAFDTFVLPSIWEGLPVVGIEAQAAGLPCIFSDAVTTEVKLTENVEFISLSTDKNEWARALAKKLTNTERPDNTIRITEAHYNIRHEAELLQKRYLELYEEATK